MTEQDPLLLEKNDDKLELIETLQATWGDQVYIDENGEVVDYHSENDYVLGEVTYPVARYREYILDTVANNLLTIITAKTGTGKSTNIPQFLFESGLYDKIVVTQPRIVAARELMKHVSSTIAKQLHDSDHNLVGFETAYEAKYSDDNAIVFVTDGLQVMREILNHGITKDQILVIDEFHERSTNMDTLLAIAVEYGIRTVVMSATLDAENLSRHYSEVTKQAVPTIEIPGVTFEVTESESSDLDKSIIEAAKLGKNILVFLPGRKEINSTMERIRHKVPKAYALLALHGDQTPDEQSRVFPNYPGGKIIFSTSVGQTSITIDDIDVVIDCGYERTGTLDKFGEHTLATQPSSRATSEQRRGRVGRTKDGEYIRAQLKGFPVLQPINETDAYDVPAIKRSRIEDLQLKLAAFGHSVASLPFYEQPEEKEVARGHERLVRLGLLKSIGKTALDGFTLTQIGERAVRLPIDVNSARMVIESQKYGPTIELQMMAAAAVQQINGITMTAKGMERWRHLTDEKDSDIIAGINFMVEAMLRTESERRSKNIVELRYQKAFRAFKQLADRRNLDIYDLHSPNSEEREKLLRCIISGADELYHTSGQWAYIDSNNTKRQLIKSTTVERRTKVVIGTSFNLQQVKNKRIATHSLIKAATNVTVDMLQEVIPERVDTVISSYEIDKKGYAKTDEIVYFDEKTTREHILRSAEPSVALHHFIINQIFQKKDLAVATPPNITKAREIISRFRNLQYRTDEDLGIGYSLSRLIEKTISETDYTALSLEEIDPFIDLDAINDIVPKEICDEIERDSPDTIAVVDGDKTIVLPVEYLEDSKRAHVTIMGNQLHLLPFTIGKHRVNVRGSKTAKYVPLEEARESDMHLSRYERRASPTSVDEKLRSVETRRRSGPRFTPYYHNGTATKFRG